MQFDAEKFIQRNAYEQATRKNEVWSIEHVIIDLPGRPIVLAALDVFSRLPVILDTTTGTPEDLVLKLDRAGRRTAYPERLGVDCGYVFESQQLRNWADRNGVEIAEPRFWNRNVAERFLRRLSGFVRDNGLMDPGEFKRKLAEWHQAYEEAAAAAIN